MKHLIEVLADNVRDKLALYLMFGSVPTINLLTDINEVVLTVDVREGSHVTQLTFELFAPLNNIQNHVNEGTGKLETKIHLNIPEVIMTSVTITQKDSKNKIRLEVDNHYEIKDMFVTYLSNVKDFKCLFNNEDGINAEVVLDNQPLTYRTLPIAVLGELFLKVVYGEGKRKKSLIRTAVVNDDTEFNSLNSIAFNAFSDDEDINNDAKSFIKMVRRYPRSLITFMDYDNATAIAFWVEASSDDDMFVLKRVSANNSKGLQIKNIFHSLLN